MTTDLSHRLRSLGFFPGAALTDAEGVRIGPLQQDMRMRFRAVEARFVPRAGAQWVVLYDDRGAPWVRPTVFGGADSFSLSSLQELGFQQTSYGVPFESFAYALSTVNVFNLTRAALFGLEAQQ